MPPYSPARLVAVNLVLAVAYFLLAKAGLLLALPPGYVTLVYPPAGLALAAGVLWGGWRVAPGILLGSFASNATIGGYWHPEMLALVIAGGSTLQGLLGAALLRRVDPQAEFGDARAIARFVGLVALTCLVAPTIGNAALVASGLLPWGQLPRSFASWWLGDALGVLVTLPMVLAFFDSRSLWRRRRVQVGVPLLAAMLLSGLVFKVVSADEKERLGDEFSAQADALLTELTSLGEANSKAVKILAALTTQEENRSPERFARNVASLRQAFPLLQSLNWLPLVRQESLVSFERSQSQQLGIPFVVKPLPGHTSSDSGWLAPVSLIEPMAGNEAALGRDMLSEPVRAQAIEKARATEQVTTTGKIVLVQDRQGPGGLLLLIPVIEKGTVPGVIAGVVNLRVLLRPLVAAPDVRWNLRDLSTATLVSETLPNPPAFAQDSHFDAQGVYIRRKFQVADRAWEIVVFKPYTAFAEAPISVSSVVLLMALVIGAGLVLFMLIVSAQSDRTERVVEDRTKQLRASEARLITTAELLERTGALAKIGGWQVDLQTMKLSWTRQTFQIAELEPPVEPPLAEGINLFAPEARPTISAAVQAAIDAGTPYDLELPIIGAKGTAGWVRTQGFAEMRDGKAVRLLGTFQDITERKKAEEALEKTRKGLSQIIDLIPEMLWVKDVDGRFLMVNEANARIYNMSAEALTGRLHSEIHSDRDEVAKMLLDDRMVIETGLPVFIPEESFLGADGLTRYLQTSKIPFDFAETGAQAILGIAIDITERKQLEIELAAIALAIRSSLREKEALLLEVHHRVKNNLQVITSLLRLEAGRSTTADTKEVLGYMRGRIRTMAQLHESLYRSGTFASVDLGVYLGQVATQAFKTQELHRDSVRLTLNLGSVQAGMDQATAAGLLINELVSNCLKHGFPEGRMGEVCVELQPVHDHDTPPAGRWCLRVSDTGVGLPSDFEDKTTSSLGLQLVGDLSQQLGGTLVIDSVPGAGARFSVIFPVQEPAPLVMPQ